jgi:hypothetical protein
MRTIIRSIGLLTLAGALLAGCGAGAGAASNSPSTPAPTIAPTVAATPTPTPATKSAIPTPVPSTDGKGDEHVIGNDTFVLTTDYRTKRVGDVIQHRGGVGTITETMNDPRVSGIATFEFSVDEYTLAGTEWGTFRLENADGAWEGTCIGAVWSSGNFAIGSCWLVGSGAYDGYTYYRAHRWGFAGPNVEGIIFPGSPPTP